MSRTLRRQPEAITPGGDHVYRPGQDDYFTRSGSRHRYDSKSDDGTPQHSRHSTRLAHRPALEPRESSYYNPRDKYYLSGDEDKELGFLGSAPARHASSSRSHRPSYGDRSRSSLSDYGRDADLTTSSRPPRSSARRPRDTYYPPSSSSTTTRSLRSGPGRGQTNRRPGPSRRTSSSTSHHSPEIRITGDMVKHATRAGMEAAAATALKLRNDPSPWIGAKGTKVAAAALGAAVVDTVIEQKMPQKKGGMRHTMLQKGATMALGSMVLKPAAKGTKMGRGL